MEPVLIVGSSGHAGVVLDALALQSRYEVAGLLDSFQPKGSKMHGYAIIGAVEDAREMASVYSCSTFFVAVGDNWRRSQISAQIPKEVSNAEFALVIHPNAVVAKSASVGPGTIVVAGAVIGVNCRVGQGCIVNTSSSVDHDCVLDDYSSVGPGAHLGGAVSVGARTSIGIGSTVRHRIALGSDTVVGAGAVVVKAIPENAVAYGIPARVVRYRSADEPYL